MSVVLDGYETLLDGVRDGKSEAPFVTLWEPGGTPSCTTHTRGGFLTLARSFSAAFRDRGLGERQTVILIMEQGAPLMAAFVGAMGLGAIPTILAYPTFKVDPDKYRSGLSGVTSNIGASLIVVDQGFPEELRRCISLQDHERLVQLKLADMRTGASVPWVDPAPEDIAFIQHSAGTTGLQKGVALSHRAVLNQLRSLTQALRLVQEDRIISWLPLYHDMGLIACFILPLVAGLHVVLQSPTDWVLRPGSMLQLASEQGCTVGWIPNFAYQFMARRVAPEDRTAMDLRALRALINCSEPVRASSMREFLTAYAAHGCSPSALQTCYAMAENTFAVTQSSIGPHDEPKALWVDRESLGQPGAVLLTDRRDASALPLLSSGRALANNRVRIMGEDRSELPEGRVGEIVIRSDSLFDGYYNRPDLTEQALHDGWYWTRDSGLMLDGELFVIGRKDDMIIIGGRNFYPQDIEEIAFQHPAIHEGRAVAFGVYSPEVGTDDLVVVAEVSQVRDLARRAEIEREIRRAVLTELNVAPRWVHVVPPKWIVKSTAGKPARSTTREKFLSCKTRES